MCKIKIIFTVIVFFNLNLAYADSENNTETESAEINSTLINQQIQWMKARKKQQEQQLNKRIDTLAFISLDNL